MDTNSDIARALRYVGSSGHHEAASDFQFGLLRDHGLGARSRVLEIGAGCLNLARKAIPVVAEGGRYVAIEPQTWLVEAGRAHFGVTAPFEHRTTLDFDGGGSFDIIYAHSVLSHVSRRQLAAFMVACARQLAPGGVALASIRFRANGEDSDLSEHDYPTISFFRRETVARAAAEAGLTLRERPEIRAAFMAATDGAHEHDWIELRRRG